VYVIKIGYEDVGLSFLQMWYGTMAGYSDCVSQKMREIF
jgi:hypothetical protein